MPHTFADKKTITVSGLYSGIGKTALAEQIVAIVPNMAAVKITIDEHCTQITDDERAIMVTGKDTFRLKSSGAGKVVWVKARPEDLSAAVQQAELLLQGYAAVLIEGNSVLNFMSPDMAVFVCDEHLRDLKAVKPARINALSKADLILFNMRGNTGAHSAQAEALCRTVNRHATFLPVDISDRSQTTAIMLDVLSRKGFIQQPAV